MFLYIVLKEISYNSVHDCMKACDVTMDKFQKNPVLGISVSR